MTVQKPQSYDPTVAEQRMVLCSARVERCDSFSSGWFEEYEAVRFPIISAVLIAGLVCCDLANGAPPPTGVPEYDQAMLRGIAYLHGRLRGEGGAGQVLLGGYRSLPAYALLACGEPVSSPDIQGAIDEVRARSGTMGYKPANVAHGNYEAGVDLMLLVQANPELYKVEIDSIAQFLIGNQQANGSYNYTAYDPGDQGDTSQAQYAALGLWAAGRAGVTVPMEVWDKLAAWHVRTQMPDGGFTYHAGFDKGAITGGLNSTINMTAGGIGTLGICKLHLYPEETIPGLAEGKKLKKRFGVLEEKKIGPDSKAPPYKPQTTLAQIDSTLQRGIGWLTARFSPTLPPPFVNPMYYYYALERGCAINFVDRLGGRIDWFRAAGDALMKSQGPDGSWKCYDGGHTGTAYVLLFFIRPTKQIIEETYGAGLLTGGRGLPDDLAAAKVSNGEIKTRKPEGPLDELLADLEKQDASMIEEAQAAIVEKIQLGKPEELIGQIDRIRKLITHPDVEVRKTAVWALGRSSDIRDANLLIQSLEDNDIGVLIEVNNSLCYLSRKVSGVGIPANPLQDLPENPPQPDVEAAVAKWRKLALERWTAWYLRVRPYSDRSDIFELKLQSKNRK